MVEGIARDEPLGLGLREYCLESVKEMIESLRGPVKIDEEPLDHGPREPVESSLAEGMEDVIDEHSPLRPCPGC